MKTNILNTKFKILIGFVLLNLVFPLAAQEEPPKTPVTNLNALTQMKVIGKFQMMGEVVQIYKIDEVIFTAISMDAFAEKVAHHLRRFTAENGFEACGLIAKSSEENLWGATLITIGSHTACPKTSAVPAGMRGTGIDIHSHVHYTRFKPSDIDKLFLVRNYGRNEMASTEPDLFSQGDFDGGEGYMVSKTKVWHQNGVGTVRSVQEVTVTSSN